MKSKLLTLYLTFLVSFVQAQDIPEDFRIVTQLLFELEQRDWLRNDIFPIMPPPPESRQYFIDLRDDLTSEQADLLFTKIENRYKEHLEEISERQIDSTFIYMATNNQLTGEECKWCGIKPDTLLNSPEYARYKQLAHKLIKGKMNNLEIPFDELTYQGRYRLKSINEFPPREEMYKGTLNFLSGGEIDFSRFYQKEDLGVIYFSISSCRMDCGAGYMVLLERKNGEWKIFDILMQWIA